VRVSDDGACGLTVFPDCHHDQCSATVYVKSAPFNEDEGNKPGTWRWPPYVPPTATTGDKAVARVTPRPIPNPLFPMAPLADTSPAPVAEDEDEPPFSDEDSQR
jgi:hypothetical protein